MGGCPAHSLNGHDVAFKRRSGRACECLLDSGSDKPSFQRPQPSPIETIWTSHSTRHCCGWLSCSFSQYQCFWEQKCTGLGVAWLLRWVIYFRPLLMSYKNKALALVVVPSILPWMGQKKEAACHLAGTYPLPIASVIWQQGVLLLPDVDNSVLWFFENSSALCTNV